MEENPVIPPETPAVPSTTVSPTLIPQEPRHRYPKAVIIFLFFAFPPLAWLLLLLDKSYHSWFPKVLQLSGLITLGVLALSHFGVGMQLEPLHEALGVEYTNAGLVQRSYIAGIIVAVLQLLFAFIIRQYLKTHPALNIPLLLVTILLLAVGSVIGFLPLILSVSALYPALYELYQGTY
jgi:hypothetical protein